MSKKLTTLLVIIVFNFLINKPIYAQEAAHILFINQVRGEECCQKGSLLNLESQIKSFKKNKIPAYFALRYDVFKNVRYLDLIKNSILPEEKIVKLGLLLEITPQLAQDSGVKYRGNDQNWFEAQNIYSIGYTKEENEKIIDHLFATFKAEFGYYPEITSSWMISTQTLNYMRNNYGVLLHQITKEQYNTDSYTLYGGPPHYPYPASSQWLMMSDYERVNAPFIVRQTVTDPLYNYGDSSTSFTSQPNDYMRNKKNINYFKKLINQAINQPSSAGFGLLGLENSIEDIYQKEYLLQIGYLKKLENEKKVKFLELNDLIKYWQGKKISVYGGGDLIHNSENFAYWINTPNYRVRLRLENNRIAITDLRIYSKDYIDPYSSKLAEKEGFWIVPYLIDGSRWYDEFKNDLKLKNVSRLEISDYKKNTLKWHVDKNFLKLEYQELSGKRKYIIFNLSQINFDPEVEKKINYFGFLTKIHPIKFIKKSNEMELIWKIGTKISHKLKIEFSTNKATMSFGVNPKLIEKLRKDQYPYLFPEPIMRDISTDKSKVIIHNRYAIANRNPVRLVVISYDVFGVPSLTKNLIKVETKPVLKVLQNFENKLNFIDISSEIPVKASVIVKIVNKQIKKENIFFAPNCSKEFLVCIKKSEYFWWYINTVIGDKMRLLINREQQ